MQSASIADLDWPSIAAELDKEGYALLPGLLDAGQARTLAARALDCAAYSPRQALDTLEPGRGETWHLAGPLPDPLAAWRAAFHEQLASIARRWDAAMGAEAAGPASPSDCLQNERDTLGARPQATLSRLHQDDCQALHQNADAERIFPIQLVVLLSEPEAEFSGGEFVMTEQRPRMQSRPIVLPLRLGDAALIAVAQRPVKGATGCYRVNLRHAISRVRSGQRVGLELLFHDIAPDPAHG